MMRNYETQIAAYEKLQDRMALFMNERFTDRSEWEGREFYSSASAEEKNEHVAKMDFHFYAFLYESILKSVETYSRRIVPNQDRIPAMNVSSDVAHLRNEFRDRINILYDLTENLSSEFLLTILNDKEFPNNLYDDKIKVDRDLYEEIVEALRMIGRELELITGLNVGGTVSLLPFQYKRSDKLVCFDNFLVDPIDKVSTQFTTNFKNFLKTDRHFTRMGSLFGIYKEEFMKVIGFLESAKYEFGFEHEKQWRIDHGSPHIFLQALMLIIKHVHEVRVNSFISRCMLDKSL